MENKAITQPDTGLIEPWRVQPATVVLMVSPCRSGSTVMLRIFGYSGFAAFFQPIKNALRWRYMGQERPWRAPETTGPVFVKETFGPFEDAETQFNPLRELIRAGVPADRLKLVVLLREPSLVWSSWRSLWGEDTRIELLAEAYHACLDTVAAAQALGVGFETLDYAACCANPHAILGSLMQRFGHELPLDAVSGWENRPGYGAPGSGVHLPCEPEPYITHGAHDPIIASRAFGPVPPRAQPTRADLEAIAGTDIEASHARLSAIRGSVAA